MTGQPFTPPELNKSAFHCPYSSCKAYASQVWGRAFSNSVGQYSEITVVKFAWCAHCKQDSIWVGPKLVFPASTSAPPPNSDLPENISSDYMEASLILANSPRGAAAILRLCIQKLCQHLGEPGENINKDIAAFVKKGLNPSIQKSLDIVRLVGNDAVHPGTIDLNDNPEIATKLFHLINIITDAMITKPKMIESIYGDLPPEKLEHIKQRDSDDG